MGFLYIKVIESKKVAVRNSFFVNYPFVRVIVGKEKKSTNFKPGIEWWDKIFTFRGVSKGDHQQITIQARDKSIHVFGSDWLGEVKVDLESEGFYDGKVHQTWFKFGRGNKAHSRSPRGYIHIAFQYTEEHVIGKRPFSVAPVEKVLTFEEWLAANNANWSSDSAMWSSSAHEPGWKVPDPRLRQSAPASQVSELSPDETRPRSKTIHNDSSVDSINPDSPSKVSKSKKSRPQDRKLSSTRERSHTEPDIRSPHSRRQAVRDSTSDDDEDAHSESDDEPRIGNLIDLSFDAPKAKMNGHAVESRKASSGMMTTTPIEHPTPNKPANLEDRIDFIKKLSLSMETPVPNPDAAASGFHVNSEPTFDEWYRPADQPTGYDVTKPRDNPFLAMHENFEPGMTMKS